MTRIFALGLEGADWSLIKKWALEGYLPTLKKFIDEGSHHTMDTFTETLHGSNWFSFFLGQQPGEHGLYSYLNWHPSTLKMVSPSSKWMDITPFWQMLKKGGAKAIVLNIPYTFSLKKFNGIEVLSLAGDHALTPMVSYPPHVADRIKRLHGGMSYPKENYDMMSFREFVAVRDDMVTLTHRLGNVYLDILKGEEWDLFLAGFPTLHRAGHRLWSDKGIRELITDEEREEVSGALRQVYMALDDALGKLMSAASPSLVLLFAFDGMRDNNSREGIFPEMLQRVLSGGETVKKEHQPQSILMQVRNSIPNSWRYKVKSMLPVNWRNQLISFWRLGRLDWSKTKAFALPLDINVGVRINLKGREKKGIVQPDRQYDDLCQYIMNELLTFVDADTGKPLIKEIRLSKEIFQGGKLDLLPDIIGHWNDDPCVDHRMITSVRYGDIPWSVPGKNPDGRSGNHISTGFLLAYGEPIRKDKIDDISIIDLAPTILHLLGEEIPSYMKGRVLPLC
jgi:predicted AlkP superfamily phosphohydrolase/phosphomutase